MKITLWLLAWGPKGAPTLRRGSLPEVDLKNWAAAAACNLESTKRGEMKERREGMPPFPVPFLLIF